MTHIEELTLYINILDGSTFIPGLYLDNEILIHMRQLHTFTFYFASERAIVDPVISLSTMDMERTFTDKEHRQICCMVDYTPSIRIICRVFSIPFKFHRLEDIGNNIPNMIFDPVTHLKLKDHDPFKHEFFVQLARAFPFLISLSIWNRQPSFFRRHDYHLRDKD